MYTEPERGTDSTAIAVPTPGAAGRPRNVLVLGATSAIAAATCRLLAVRAWKR
jgi:hypothetical protein